MVQLITISYIELQISLIFPINLDILVTPKLKVILDTAFTNTQDNGIFATIMTIKMLE
jgi:hypothetical protein